MRERVRWLPAEHLERVDAFGRSTTIFDRDAREVTLLTSANRTYPQIGRQRRAGLLEPEPGAVLKRGADAVVGGLPCTDWSWTEDGEKHTVCATTDGVMLRLVVDGATFIQARSVKYAPQKAELFQCRQTTRLRSPPKAAPSLKDGRSRDRRCTPRKRPVLNCRKFGGDRPLHFLSLGCSQVRRTGIPDTLALWP